jgi:hypothetical protein
MTLLLSGMRIALVIYVAAVVALYVLQDRLLLPPVENVTDIQMGHYMMSTLGKPATGPRTKRGLRTALRCNELLFYLIFLTARFA